MRCFDGRYTDIRNFPSDPLTTTPPALPPPSYGTFVHQTICPLAATSARSVLTQRTREQGGGVIFINTDLDKYIPPRYELALLQFVNCMPM
jgi:hypothetical protein